MGNDSCVFVSSDHPGVDSSGQIEKFQEKALMELQDYVQKTYPDDMYRYIHNCSLSAQPPQVSTCEAKSRPCQCLSASRRSIGGTHARCSASVIAGKCFSSQLSPGSVPERHEWRPLHPLPDTSGTSNFLTNSQPRGHPSTPASHCGSQS